MTEIKEAVTLLYLNDEGKILSVSRKDNHLAVGMPGGKVDDNETKEDALIREVFEETGYEIYDLVYFFSVFDGHYNCTTFTARIANIGCPLPVNKKETGKVSWITWDDFKKGPFSDYNSALEKHYLSVTPL